MRTFNIFLAFMLMVCLVTVQAQTQQTLKRESIKVYGNCEMCKARIEKAAKEAGAASAKWNVDTKMLAVHLRRQKLRYQKLKNQLLVQVTIPQGKMLQKKLIKNYLNAANTIENRQKR